MKKILLLMLIVFALMLVACDVQQQDFSNDDSNPNESVCSTDESVSDTSTESVDESFETSVPDVSDTSEAVSEPETSEVSEPEESEPEESEVSEPEESEPEESIYEVVYHTEYIPKAGFEDIYMENFASDRWHYDAYFQNPPSSFYEYFSDRYTTEHRFLMDNAYEVDSLYEEFSYGFWLEYFKITKEEYIAYLDWAVDMNDPEAVEKFDKAYPLARCVSGWYSGNYYTYEHFVLPNAAYKPDHYYAKNTDGKHNSRYYAIHESLIEYVGESKFEEFLEKYEDTTDCNIVKFVEYFDLDYVEFNKAMAKRRYSDIYEPQYKSATFYLSRFIYGSDAERDAFFGFYDGDIWALSVFVPREMHYSTDMFYGNLTKFHDPRVFGLSTAFKNYFMIDPETGEYTEEAKKFEKIFGGTYLHNYSFYIDYYGITREEWQAFLDKVISDTKDLNTAYANKLIIGELAFDIDLLFGDVRFLDCPQIEYATDYPYYTYYGEIMDDRYNEYYYMIDRRLIEHVGLKAFNKFLEKYEGTADCNLMKFLEFNDLSKYDVDYVYRSEYGEPVMKAYNASILDKPDSEEFMAFFGSFDK